MNQQELINKKNEFHKRNRDNINKYIVEQNKKFEEMKLKFKNYKFNYIYFLQVSVEYYKNCYSTINRGGSYVYSTMDKALEECLNAFGDMNQKGKKKLFVVSDVPLKRTKPIYKYCENKYKLSFFFKTNFIRPGSEDIYEREFYEKDIETFKGNVPEKYELLSKILKGEIKVDGDYMHNVEIGVEELNKENVEKNLVK